MEAPSATQPSPVWAAHSDEKTVSEPSRSSIRQTKPLHTQCKGRCDVLYHGGGSLKAKDTSTSMIPWPLAMLTESQEIAMLKSISSYKVFKEPSQWFSMFAFCY